MSRRLNLDTNVGRDQRYSFLETPLEMHAAGHPETQPLSLPVESYTYETQQPAVSDIPRPASTATPEKARSLEKSAISTYPSCPPPSEHPANFAPFADGIILEKQNTGPQVPQYAYDAPPNSPRPFPVRTNQEAVDEAQKVQPIAIVPDMNPLQSPQLPRSPPPVASTTIQAAAPNDIIAYHQPGQISHPNQEINGGTWNHGLCDCSRIGTCCLGLVCPCILYGRTQYRLSMKSRKEDPTNLLGFEMCNGSCMAMALLCGCQCKQEPYSAIYLIHRC